jgi:predicted ribosomally synthesized peptide with SipW-like signal peptide
MKKRVLGLAIAATAIIGLVASGTLAQFTDTETATDNTFTAGTLNLQVGSADPCTETIAIGDDEDLYPTVSSNAATWLTQNTGSIAGDLTISIGAITNNENTRSEVEEDAGDTTDGATSGELGGLLKVAFWMDGDKSGDWDDTSDYYLKSDETKVAYTSGGPVLPAAAYDILDNYGSDSWTDVQNVGATSEAGNFRVEYNWPDGGSTDNQAQSDDCVFTITFDLEQ